MRSLILRVLAVLAVVLLAAVALECIPYLVARQQSVQVSEKWKRRWETDTRQMAQQQKVMDDLLAKDRAEIARQEQLIKELQLVPRPASAAAVQR